MYTGSGSGGRAHGFQPGLRNLAFRLELRSPTAPDTFGRLRVQGVGAPASNLKARAKQQHQQQQQRQQQQQNRAKLHQSRHHVLLHPAHYVPLVHHSHGRHDHHVITIIFHHQYIRAILKAWPPPLCQLCGSSAEVAQAEVASFRWVFEKAWRTLDVSGTITSLGMPA